MDTHAYASWLRCTAEVLTACFVVALRGQVEFQEHYVNKSYQKAASRKENYHHPRALMLVIEILERMGQRDGAAP